MSQPKYGQIIISCDLAIMIVSLFCLCRLRNATQLRSGTVDKMAGIQNASGNPNIATTCKVVHTRTFGDPNICCTWPKND